MISTTFQLARRDFWYLIRQPVTLLWAFIMPVIFFGFIGKITGRFAGPDPARRDPIAVLVPADAGFIADALLRHLTAAGYDITRVASESELARFDRQLTVPPGLSDSILAGKPQKLTFNRRGEPGLGGDYDKIRLSRATYSLLAEIIAVRRDGKTPTPESLLSISQTPRSLTIDTKPAGKRRVAPSGYQQSVPGTLVMFVLVVMLTTGGVSIVVERKLGILRRLASSPMPRGSIVAAKWCSRFGLAIIQTTVGAIAGTLLFSIEWGTSWSPSPPCSPPTAPSAALSDSGSARSPAPRARPPPSASSPAICSALSAAAGGPPKSPRNGCRSSPSSCPPASPWTDSTAS